MIFPEKVKIVLKFPNFLGDQVIFTGALRALHKTHPERFITAVNVDRDVDLLWGNPYISKVVRNDSSVRALTKSIGGNFRNHKTSGKHCIEVFVEKLAKMLNVEIKIDELHGDIHLSDDERSRPPINLEGRRYWVIFAGCKTGIPTKSWGTVNYQSVVDALSDKIHFVQCGSRQAGWHPPLHGVTNLVAKTSVRDLIRTIYHSDGVLCPITSAMHLAAAIPVKSARLNPRPCVVLAGGREPMTYIAYPGHIVLATIGALPCSLKPCGHSKFAPRGGCKRPIKMGAQQIPECMKLIQPSEVVAAILRASGDGDGHPIANLQLKYETS
jgi:ADP-heptose:LPS heptosyltransferase